MDARQRDSNTEGRAWHENSTAASIEDEIPSCSASISSSSEEGTGEFTQPRSEEATDIPTRNGIFENPSLHETDLSTPLCGYTDMGSQASIDSTMPRNTSCVQQGNCPSLERRLSCNSVCCLLTLVVACVLLITGKHTLQQLGGGLFGVSIVLCIVLIIQSVMHGPAGGRQRSQSGHTHRQTVPETPLNFDISQARTEWLMSTTEVHDKDKPPSYNMVTRALLSGEKPGRTEASNLYFMHFPTNLFSTTDCENCEDVANPPPSYESIFDLILTPSQRNTLEEEPITITCAESPREHAGREVTHERDAQADTFPVQKSREDHVVVVDVNT